MGEKRIVREAGGPPRLANGLSEEAAVLVRLKVHSHNLHKRKVKDEGFLFLPLSQGVPYQ